MTRRSTSRGGTSLARARRQADPWMMQAVFRGRALDIGPGADPLTREDYPALEAVDACELALGHDARDLSAYGDGAFDLVYSSHCLEHIPIADLWDCLRGWWRVVAVGGHLAIVVPDADLYEHGCWPSIHNGDHRSVWSLWRTESDLPAGQRDVACHLIPLCCALPGMVLEHAVRLRAGCRNDGRDNTARGAEAACEIILRRAA